MRVDYPRSELSRWGLDPVRVANATLAAVFFLAGLVAGLDAQDRTSAISGVVRDASGAVVPGASIVVKRNETDAERHTKSGARGLYRLPLLEVGEYDVTATMNGFRSSTQRGIVLQLDREAVVDHVLQVGELEESITVATESRSVEASLQSITALVNSKAIEELPLNGRDYLQLATLQAGAHVSRAQTRDVNMGFGLQISISGSRPAQNSFRLDGVSINNYAVTPGSLNGVNLGVDAIREFSVIGTNPSAQYGRVAGGVINAVTRSGTNDFHGSTFYFHRNDNFDARNFFDGESVPEFRRHQFGGSLGGPISQNRSFFFVSYERLQEVRGRTTIDTTLSDDVRRGFLTTGAVTVDPAIAQIVDLYPRPNGEVLGDTGLFSFANDQESDEDFVTTRFDQHLGNFDKLFGRYSFDDGARLDETSFALGLRRDRTRMHSAALEESHIFSPSLLNTARLGFMRTYTVNGGTRSQVAAIDNPDLSFLPGGTTVGVIEVSGLTDFPGGTGALDADVHAFNSYQVTDDLIWNRGDHSLRFGGRLERTHFNTDSQNRVSGEYRFRSIAQFLTNDPDRFRGQLPGSDTIRGHRQWIAAWYVQDTWRVTSKLTLDLGLRHEWMTPPSEVNGKVSNLDAITNTQVRLGEPLFDNPSLANLMPRVGLAWDIAGNGNTVVRSGYGIFPDLILSQFILLSGVRNPPFFSRGSTRDLSPGDFPNGGYQVLAANADADLRVERFEPNPRQPYVQQWNLNLEQRLAGEVSLRLAYVGSHGLNLSSITEDANLVNPTVLSDGRLFFPEEGEKINTAFSQIRDRNFDAHSFHHGFQARLFRRFRDRVQLQASYSFSKTIDDSSVFFASSEAANSNLLPLNGYPKFNRGRAGHDVPHYFVLNGIWELPSPSNRGWKHVFGGWQVSSIISYASGPPLTARLAYDAARTQTSRTDGRSGQRPDLVPGANNNPVTGDPRRWFDPASFQRPVDGFLGNLGRNTIHGPNLATVDLSLVKRVPLRFLGDAARLDFRAEFYNLFNRTNFDLPTFDRTEVFTATSTREDIGRITSAGESREIQFGLKLRF